jgi:hypothetical protein
MEQDIVTSILKRLRRHPISVVALFDRVAFPSSAVWERGAKKVLYLTECSPLRHKHARRTGPQK